MVRASLAEYLKGLETKVVSIEEFRIGQEISRILNSKEEKVTDPEELAELTAFQFTSDYPNRADGWGLYYGPLFVLKNDQGQFVEFPSLKHITAPIVEYWKIRSESPHPILARQYADLVLEFEPKVLGVKFDYKFAQKVIDRVIDICNKELDDGLGCKMKLSRAFELAKRLNDTSRIEQLKKVIVETENKYAEDDKPGLWGHAFEWLVLDDSGQVKLTDIERDALVAGLEERLARQMDTDNPDPWRVERAVQPLSEFYSRIPDEKKVEVVITKLETAFRKNSHANSDGLLITNYLEKLLEIYSGFSSRFPFAQVSYERILQELSTPDARRKFEGHEISVEVPISKKDIEKFLTAIFDGPSSEPRHLEKVLAKLAVNFIPKKDHVEKQLRDMAQKHPLQFLMGGRIISDDGYTIAEMGSIEEDFDQRLLEHFSKNLHFQTVFVSIGFNELKKRFSPEDVYAVLSLSPVFREEDREYILKLLRAFWNGDYLTTSCLSVPLIEDCVRNLFKLNKVTFIKPSRYGGGFDVLSLGDLLRQGLLKQVYQKLGENVEYYFKVILTEKVGWNLRNNFAHGVNKWAFAQEEYASRLLHVLLCLALIRKKPDEESKKDAA